MEIAYQLTLDDYQEMVAAQQAKSLRLKIIVAMCFCVFYILGILVLMAFGLSQALASVVFLSGTLILGGVCSLWWRLWLRQDFRRHPNLARKERVRIDESGLYFENEVSSSNMKWLAYVKHRETQNLFVLYLGPRSVHAFPKRAFSSEQLEEFRRLLQRMLDTRKISPERSEARAENAS